MLNMNELKKQISPMELARKLGIPPTTVYSWGVIPRWREDAVRKVCEKNGIKVKPEDFKGE